MRDLKRNGDVFGININKICTLSLQRYLTSLQRPEDTELAMLTRTVSTIPGASPEEYLMFLLRAHNNEHKDSLPVVDMLW